MGLLSAGYLIHFVDDRGELLRNYDLNLWIASTINIIGFFIIMTITIDRKDLHGNHDDSEEINGINSSTLNATTENSSSRFQQISDTLKMFFDVENVKNTFKCLTISRKNNARELIILLIVIMFVQFLNYFGLDAMFLQFSQKVYHFDSKTFAYISGISKIVPNIGLIIGTYLLVKILKWKDGTIYALTFSSTIISQVLVGSFINPKVYLISLFIGCIGGLSSIVMKTEISRIIPKDEIGKIFSVISTLESLAPFFGTLLFSTIFSASVSIYPSLIYHVGAALKLICLMMALFQDIYFQPYIDDAPSSDEDIEDNS